jgi:hypothetical protein
MNWRRNLLRIWLALSLGWIVGIAVGAWKQGPRHDEAWHKDMDACLEARKAEGLVGAEPWLDCYVANTPRVPARMTLTDIPAALREYGMVALVPPLAPFVLGLLSVWVVSGFARRVT